MSDAPKKEWKNLSLKEKTVELDQIKMIRFLSLRATNGSAATQQEHWIASSALPPRNDGFV
jgi:hypothetical protein